ncbi:MAG TPA: lysylphosphatidylglycerol synthase transmembrane domain-containing protein [Chloroflexota bacterium]|nr:lysylphosphatidylglycerol synthase transmembrane domain-containing protein [Chloroflexota bacterium]
MVKWRSLAIGLLVSAVCIWLLLRTIDPAGVAEALGSADPGWLGLALLSIAASFALRCWRWQLFFLPADRVGFWAAFAPTMIGYMLNTVLPGRVGELARAALVSRTEGVSTARALGTILVEKIVDVLVLLLIIGGLTAVLPLPPEATAAGLTAAVLFGGVAVLFFVMSQVRGQVVAWAERRLDHLPLLGRVKPSALADLVLGAADSLRVPHLLALQLVLAALMWVVAYGTIYAITRAFGMDVPWSAPALVLAMTNLGMTVPSAPGYVGVYHYIATLALRPFGVDEEVAAAFAITLHAVSFGSMLVIGVSVLLLDLARQRFTMDDLWKWNAARSPG